MARERATDTWRTADGQVLRLVGWPAAAGASALLVMHHGLGEHAGRYDDFANELVDLPLAIWGYDARGHGGSDGRRGHASLGAFADDLHALIPALAERASCDRVILFGHSMGAAVVAHYLATRSPHAQIEGVILSSPPVHIHETPAIRFKIALGRLLSRVVPRLTLANEIDPNNISSDPAQVRRYLEDPLVHDRISMKLGASLVDDSRALPERVGSVRLPVLLYQGRDDGVVQVSGTEALAAALPDVELHLFDGMRHECHHEHPDLRPKLFEVLRAWLGKQIGEAARAQM